MDSNAKKLADLIVEDSPLGLQFKWAKLSINTHFLFFFFFEHIKHTHFLILWIIVALVVSFASFACGCNLLNKAAHLLLNFFLQENY